MKTPHRPTLNGWQQSKLILRHQLHWLALFASVSAAAGQAPLGTTDCGGGTAASLSYSVVASIGQAVAASSQSVDGSVTLRAQPVILQSQASSLSLLASQDIIHEDDCIQLSGVAIMDDGSITALSGSEIAWSNGSGSIESIDPQGLAKTRAIYADSLIGLTGFYQHISVSRTWPVLNDQPDNYGMYANDEIDDSWQVQYFGLENPLAGAEIDSDGDHHNNYFEFVANLNPREGMSSFHTEIKPSSSQAGGMDISFWPVFDNRVYTLLRATSLEPVSWAPLTTATSVEANGKRTITDPSGNERTEFYRIEIIKP